MMHKTLIFLLAFGTLAPAAESRRPIGKSGDFDYYLLTLSWSPAYCAGRQTSPNDPQCGSGRHFAFVLHGLWPQYLKARNDSLWPQFCSDQPGPADPGSLLDIMPSRKLIEHEWDKHGTCSGMDAKGYFGFARKQFSSVKIPQKFANLGEYLNPSPNEVKKAFLDANPSIPPDGIVIGCSANYLSEVRICLDKSGKPIACTGQRDCKAQTVRMPPVR